MSRARRLPLSTLGALTLVLLGAAGSWGVALASPGPRVAISGALVVVIVATVVHLVRRAPSLVAAVVVESAVAVAAWPLVGPTGGRSFTDLARGAVDGWHSILSAAVPVPAVPAAAAFAYLLTVIAAITATELTLRTPTRVWPLVPGIVIAATAYLLGRGGPDAAFVASVLLVIGAVAFGLLRARTAGLGGRPFDEAEPDVGDPEIDAALTWSRRDAGIGVAVIAGAVVGVLLLVVTTPVLGGRGPRELHDDYEPRIDVGASGNPLDEVGARSTAADRGVEVFNVRLDRGFSECTPQRVDRCPRFPLAYLTTVDGTGQWSTADDLRAASDSVRSGDGSRPPSVTVRQRITVRRAYDRAVLPGLERLVAVSGTGDRSSSADAATGQRSFVAGPSITYDAVSRVPVVPAESVARARAVPGDTATTGVLDLGGFSALERINRAAQGCKEAGASVTPDAARLCALERRFASGGFRIGPLKPARAHALRDLDAVFAEDGAAASSEQFATAFADLAARNGYRVRVVVGYQFVTSSREFTIRENDLAAWPEVELRGIGWVPFSPFPGQQGAVPTTTTTSTTAVPSEDSSTTSTTTGFGNGGGAECADPSQCRAVQVGGGRRSSPVPAVIALVLVAVVAGLALPSVVRARRRRRARTTGDPATRIAAAWNDTMRTLREDGIDATECLTRERAGSIVNDRYDTALGADVDALGTITDGALHAPAGSDQATATEAWARADRIRTAVDRTRPKAQRLLHRIAPGLRVLRK